MLDGQEFLVKWVYLLFVQVMNKKKKIDGEVYCFEDSSEELVEFIKKIRIDIAILDKMLKFTNDKIKSALGSITCGCYLGRLMFIRSYSFFNLATEARSFLCPLPSKSTVTS